MIDLLQYLLVNAFGFVVDNMVAGTVVVEMVERKQMGQMITEHTLRKYVQFVDDTDVVLVLNDTEVLDDTVVLDSTVWYITFVIIIEYGMMLVLQVLQLYLLLLLLYLYLLL